MCRPPTRSTRTDTPVPYTSLFQSLIEQPLMASFGGRVEGVLVRGMEMDDIRTNPTLNEKVIDGRLRNLAPDRPVVAIGVRLAEALGATVGRSEAHTSELQSLMRISYAVCCLHKKNTILQQPL